MSLLIYIARCFCHGFRTHPTADRHTRQEALYPRPQPHLSTLEGSGRVGATSRSAGRCTGWRIRSYGVLSVNGRRPVPALYLRSLSKYALYQCRSQLTQTVRPVPISYLLEQASGCRAQFLMYLRVSQLCSLSIFLVQWPTPFLASLSMVLPLECKKCFGVTTHCPVVRAYSHLFLGFTNDLWL